MHELKPFLILVLFGVVFIAVIYGAVQASIRERKLLEGLINLSRRLNLTFNAGLNYTIPDRFDFLKELSKGDNRYAMFVFSGVYQQNEVMAFDFHYETESTDSKGNRTITHHWLSIFLLTLPVSFPDLTVRRENFFTRVAEVFGYQDINFESAEFSKAFNVRSPDRKFAYDVCNARMIEYFLEHRDLNLEINRNILALAYPSRLDPEKFEANLQQLSEIRSRLPDYLFSQVG